MFNIDEIECKLNNEIVKVIATKGETNVNSMRGPLIQERMCLLLHILTQRDWCSQLF